MSNAVNAIGTLLKMGDGNSNPVQNEVQVLTINGVPTGGTWVPQKDGILGAAVPYNVAPAALQTALTAMSSIGAGNIVVTGVAGGPYTCTAAGALLNVNISQITGDGTGLTGGSGMSVTGTTTQQGSSGTESFTTIAEVTSISGPSFGADTHEVTNHSSPGGNREFIPGLGDPGEVSFDVNFMPNDPTHVGSGGMLVVMQQRVKRNFQLAFPTSPARYWAFAGIITKWDVKAPIDDRLTASCTIKISSTIAFN